MEIFHALVENLTAGEKLSMCIIVDNRGSTPRRVGSKMLVYPDGSILGTVGGGEMENRVRKEAINAMQDGRPRLLEFNMVDPANGDPGVCGGSLEVYVEPISPRPTLVIIGMGHIGKEVAHLAHRLDFRIVITDDREEFCSQETIPDADERYPIPMAEFAETYNIKSDTYIVFTTRGSDVDVAGLPAILESPAAYIGIIGSKRRWIHTRNLLIEKGVSTEKLGRINSPIGLDLGGEKPAEIAVSILAEILMMQNRGSGNSMDVNRIS